MKFSPFAGKPAHPASLVNGPFAFLRRVGKQPLFSKFLAAKGVQIRVYVWLYLIYPTLFIKNNESVASRSFGLV